MMLPKLQHTFTRPGFTLWADRVPAMFGFFNIFTLWHYVPGKGWTRPVGGGTMSDVRRYLNGV